MHCGQPSGGEVPRKSPETTHCGPRLSSGTRPCSRYVSRTVLSCPLYGIPPRQSRPTRPRSRKHDAHCELVPRGGTIAPLPADPDTITAYLASQADTLSYGMLLQRLAAVVSVGSCAIRLRRMPQPFKPPSA
jgi:hypothetical protein